VVNKLGLSLLQNMFLGYKKLFFTNWNFGLGLFYEGLLLSTHERMSLISFFKTLSTVSKQFVLAKKSHNLNPKNI
jgi:hypothetical protein